MKHLDKIGLLYLWNKIKNRFAPNDHNHDARYYTETETESKLSAKANTSHTHNYAGSLTAGGSATGADKLNTSAGGPSQPVYFSNGVPVALAGRWPTSTFKTAFRTQAKGDTAQGSFLTTIRNQHAGVDSLPQYGSGIAFGQGDTNAFLSTSYAGAEAYIGAGSGNSIAWSKKIAFTDSNVASATKAATATSATTAATATKATQDSDGNAINTTYLKKSGGTISNSWTSFAGFQGLTVHRSNLSALSNGVYMKYAGSVSDCGFVGMNGNGDFRTADKNGTNTSIISGNGILKTAGGGKLLYSGTVGSATSANITIENLWSYGAVLIQILGTSSGRTAYFNGVVPIAYVNDGNTFTIYNSTYSSKTASGATTISYNLGVNVTKSSTANTMTLAGQNMGNSFVLGTIKVYSLY